MKSIPFLKKYIMYIFLKKGYGFHGYQGNMCGFQEWISWISWISLVLRTFDSACRVARSAERILAVPRQRARGAYRSLRDQA